MNIGKEYVMSNCKNCFLPIDDLRTAVKCNVCDSHLHKDCAISDKEQYFCDVCYTVKSEESTDCKLDFTVPEVIRRSYIETYKSCPYKFYLQVIKGIEENYNNVYAQVGIDLHDLFNIACNNHRYNEQKMFAQFIDLWDNYDPIIFADNEQKQLLYNRSVNSISSFYKILPSYPKVPFTTEETIQFSIGDGLPIVQTTMDRIDKIDGELEVTDWKTGKTMVGQKLSSDMQAPLYIYGIREHFKLPVSKFTFVYVNEDKIRTFIRESENTYICQVKNRTYRININDTIKQTQSLFSRINKGDFNIPYNIKSMFFTCKMCYLQKTRCM